eukprot:6492543-Amphidinium_carterae.1
MDGVEKCSGFLCCPWLACCSSLPCSHSFLEKRAPWAKVTAEATTRRSEPKMTEVRARKHPQQPRLVGGLKARDDVDDQRCTIGVFMAMSDSCVSLGRPAPVTQYVTLYFQRLNTKKRGEHESHKSRNFPTPGLSSDVSYLHCPLTELAEVRTTVFSLIDVQTFEVVFSKRVGTQVHITNEQAS